MKWFFLILAAVIALIYIIVEISKHDFEETVYEEPQRTAGRRGEEKAALVIKSILRDGDFLLSNVRFTYDNRRAELDCVVVNRYGVFIIEVKNYAGYIVGKEDDYEWVKHKMTESRNIYVTTVKNPIKQVKRQVYLLAKYLNYYGINVWVRGYALLMKGNSPVDSDYILSSVADIDNAIHTKDRTLLSHDTIEQIKDLLSD